MKIDILDLGDERALCFREVFSGVMFETKEGERLAVCMRDGSFDISLSHRDTTRITWYHASTGGVELAEVRNPKKNNSIGG